jgi:hypothetical protein
MDGHILGATQQRADKLPNPDNTFLFRVTAIDFGSDTWRKDETIKVKVPSKTPMRLVQIMSGSEDNSLVESFTIGCG